MWRDARRWWRRLWTKPLPEQAWFEAERQPSDDPFVTVFTCLAREAQLDHLVRLIDGQRRASEAHQARLKAALAGLQERMSRL